MIEIINKYSHFKTSQDADGNRWYGTEETPFMYPSVSTIQKLTIPPPKQVVDWMINITRKIYDDTMDRTSTFGTKCHEYFEKIMKEEKLGRIPKEYTEHVKNFQAWKEDNKVKHIASEFAIVSEKYGYAGRVDELAEVDGKVELLDWKTGNNYKDDWASQAGGYHLALCEMLQVPSEAIGLRVIQVKRQDGSLKQFKYQHVDFLQDSFLLCLERFKRAPQYMKLKKIGWKYVTEKSMVRAT